jgi:hypothetical protein
VIYSAINTQTGTEQNPDVVSERHDTLHVSTLCKMISLRLYTHNQTPASALMFRNDVSVTAWKPFIIYLFLENSPVVLPVNTNLKLTNQ